MSYDYAIVGGGPSGLTLAYVLGKKGYKCILIDKNPTLGGCHRVARYKGLFSEHGPRIYTKAFLNFELLLKHMGFDFDDFFTEYKFSAFDISSQISSHLSTKELFLLFVEFIKLVFDSDHGKNISVRQFLFDHNYSLEAIKYINKICLATDGADITRYTLFQLLQTVNTNTFTTKKILQPTTPNDNGFIAAWIKKILNTGNVDILPNTDVIKLENKLDKISSITVQLNNVNATPGSIKNSIQKITASNFILAIPPTPIIKLLEKSSSQIHNAFGDFQLVKKWAIKHNYTTFVSITYHWDQKLDLPKIWGVGTKSEWNVVSIVLSDYMNFNQPVSTTVISTCISLLNKKSKFLHKTANECNDEELRSEVFRQLKYIYPNLPQPSAIIINPNIHKTVNGWIDDDTAFIRVGKENFMDPQTDVLFRLKSRGS